MSGDRQTYQIKYGNRPAGNAGAYDMKAVRHLIQATDPGTVAAAGKTHDDRATALAEFNKVLRGVAAALAEAWQGAASAKAQQALQQVDATNRELVARNQQMGRTLQWYGGQILPWYKEHLPDDGLIHTGKDDTYAQEFMGRLNERIAQTWDGVPDQVDKNLPNIGMYGEEDPFGSPTRRSGSSAGSASMVRQQSSAGDSRTDPLAGSGQSFPQPIDSDEGDATGSSGSGGAGSPSSGAGAIGAGSGTDLAGLGPAASGGASGPGGPFGTGGIGGASGAGLGSPGILGGSGAGGGLIPGVGVGAPGSGGRPGISGPAAGGRPGAGGLSDGQAGRAGRPGMPGVGAPHGSGEDEERERQRTTYMSEEPNIWGAQEGVPPVLGLGETEQSRGKQELERADVAAEPDGDGGSDPVGQRLAESSVGDFNASVEDGGVVVLDLGDPGQGVADH